MVLNALDASISNTPQPSFSRSWNKSDTASIAPSIPALTPPHNCEVLHISSRSYLVNIHTVLPAILHNVSPTPMGRTPEHLSKATSLQATNARISSHEVTTLERLRTRAATESRSLLLWAPYLRRTSCQWPAFPWIREAIRWIWAPVTSKSSLEGRGSHFNKVDSLLVLLWMSN